MRNTAMPPSLVSLHVPQPRPGSVAEANAERLHRAVVEAWHDGHDKGEKMGHLAGARAVGFAAFCWGVAVGIGLAAVAFHSGLAETGLW